MTKLPWQCEYKDCELKKEGKLPYCGSHNAMFRREARKDKQPKPSVRPLQKSYIRKVSEKRKSQNDEYSVLREKFLKENPICKACETSPSTAIHHLKGRENDLLNEIQYWMPVCNICHNEIHANPEWARQHGYLILRSV